MAKIDSYLNFLKEKVTRWKEITEEILTLLRRQDFDLVLEKTAVRDQVIEAYFDCLHRLESSFFEQFPDSSAKEGEVLRYMRTNEQEFSVYQEPLKGIRSEFDLLLGLDEQIIQAGSKAPEKLKLELMRMQQKKPGINAYQRNRSSLSKFNRFDRDG